MTESDSWRELLQKRWSRRRLLQAGAVTGAGLWLGSALGCGGSSSNPTPQAQQAVGTQGPVKPSGKITIALGTEPLTLDAHKYTAGADSYFSVNIYEGLLGRDTDGKLVPRLATSYNLSTQNGLPVVDFELRKDVKFHNGDPFTAKDVIFSEQRQADPKTGTFFPSYFAAIDRIEAPDDYHVRFFFKKPDAVFIPRGGAVTVIPKDYFEKVGEKAFGDNPVGTGPYKFVERKIKEYFTLEAHEDYWDGASPIKTAVFKIIPEEMTRVSMLKTGEVDFADNLPPAMVSDVESTKGLKTYMVSDNNNIFLNINSLPGSKFADKRVRQAMAYAIDTKSIIDKVLYGRGVARVGALPGVLGYDPNLKPYPYDPAKAKQVLADAGYSSGFDTTMYGLLPGRVPYSVEVGEAVAGYLTAVGIRTKVQNLEYAAWINLGKRGVDPDIDTFAFWMWGDASNAEPDPRLMGIAHTFVAEKGYGAYSYHSDPALDKMIEDQENLMDVSQREALLKQIIKVWVEDVVALDLYSVIVTFGSKDTIDWKPWAGSPNVIMRNMKFK